MSQGDTPNQEFGIWNLEWEFGIHKFLESRLRIPNSKF